MNATRIYPGMCDGNLEIFFHREENKLKGIQNGEVKDFSDLDETSKSFLFKILFEEEDTQQVLEEMFPKDTVKQIEKLARCRFGGLNFQSDFCPKTGAMSADFIECDIRENCKGCGIVCRNVKYNGSLLDCTDTKAIQLMASDHKTEVLAEELGMPLGSFHVYRTKLFRRLGVKSKPELARVGVELGLI